MFLEQILSVSELNAYVQRSLSSDPILQGVRLRGEISNFKRHSSGHLYFSLKDEAARIQCVMFRQSAQMCALRPEDGFQVVALGRAALYPRDGQYQFYIESMRMDGVGALYLRYEQLRRKLMEEGLFDAALKKPLPLLPRGVGIVTSETGAVIRDIQNVASRRHPGVPLFLYPAKVQGDGSAEDVARGILYLDEYNEADIIIIARGGGSLEDLWAFNEEIVARAIYDCSKPVISAVGHETDTSLSDFAADARAPTPSAAAEIAVPKLEALEEEIARCAARLTRGVNMRIAAMRERTRALSHRLTIRRPDRVIAENRLRVARLSEMIALCARQAFGPRRMRVNGLIERLNALDPTRVLTRGYAILTDESGRCLPDAAAVDIGQRIVVRMRDGTVGARVSDKG